MITLRPAEPADAALLRAWANDRETRAASFHSDPIDAATHERWLADRLASPSSRLFVGLEDGRPVAQARLERGDRGRVEVGISVAPEARRRGVGQEMLRITIDAGRADEGLAARTFVGRIRPGNAASIALFEDAGFRLADGDATCRGVPCLVYERPVG